MKNSIKMTTRGMMKANGFDGKLAEYLLRVRNMFKYKNPLGPSLDDMTKNEAKSYDQVIENALKTSEKFNRLIPGTML